MFPVLKLKSLVNLHRRLHKKEGSSGQENEIATGEFMARYGEQRLGKLRQPKDRGQKQQS